MEGPVVIRCVAAFWRKVVAVVLLGYMAVAVPVYVVMEGTGEGLLMTLLGGLVYLCILGAAIAHAIGLRCRMIFDEEGVTFVEPVGEDWLRWDAIDQIEIGGDSHTWEVRIEAGERELRPSALKCLRWFGTPRSLRRCVDLLEARRAGARAKDAG